MKQLTWWERHDKRQDMALLDCEDIRATDDSFPFLFIFLSATLFFTDQSGKQQKINQFIRYDFLTPTAKVQLIDDFSRWHLQLMTVDGRVRVM